MHAQAPPWCRAPACICGMGFNSPPLRTTDGDRRGTAVRYLNQDAQSVLKMAGAVSVSQEYNSLEPGKKYVTYVSVDNRSDAKAAMTVTDEKRPGPCLQLHGEIDCH